MAGPTKCVRCNHVARSHDEGKCDYHCTGFRAPTRCPLGIEWHNTSRGHLCDCVPGQLSFD